MLLGGSYVIFQNHFWYEKFENFQKMLIQKGENKHKQNKRFLLLLKHNLFYLIKTVFYINKQAACTSHDKNRVISKHRMHNQIYKALSIYFTGNITFCFVSGNNFLEKKRNEIFC